MNSKALVLLFISILISSAVFYDWWSVPEFIATQPDKAETNYGLVPNFDFTTLNNSSHNIRTLEEDTILIHFWASWCTSCIIEFPDIIDLVEESNGKLALVAISIDSNKAAMKRFLDRLRRKKPKTIDSPHIYWIMDKKKKISLEIFNVTRVPETIIINDKKIMIDKIIGEYNWKEINIQKMLSVK